MPVKRWGDFFLYLGRVFILLILLAVLLPKLMAICNTFMSSLLHNEQKPIGNPLRVEGKFPSFVERSSEKEGEFK